MTLKEEIIKKHQEAFGDKFHLWSEYGWWLEQISLIQKRVEEVLPKEIDEYYKHIAWNMLVGLGSQDEGISEVARVSSNQALFKVQSAIKEIFK